MKIQFETSPYQLIPVAKIGGHASAQLREGVLIKFTFSKGEIGYADCFPWVELGDLPLLRQMENLRKGELTPLMKRSIEFARIDAEARLNGKDLFHGACIPKSHALLTSWKLLNPLQIERLSERGYQEIKLKVGSSQKNEIETLNRVLPFLERCKVKLRLDFNSSGSEATFEEFMEQTSEIHERIDFVEDPFPYDAKSWSRIQQKWGIRLAFDRAADMDLSKIKKGSVSVLILKPAVQAPDAVIQISKQLGVSLVVTSYLDHPLGQLSAAWLAAQIHMQGQVQLESCGLTSHTAYEQNPFSQQIKVLNAQLCPPGGTGFGMDELLNSLEWKKLP